MHRVGGRGNIACRLHRRAQRPRLRPPDRDAGAAPTAI